LLILPRDPRVRPSNANDTFVTPQLSHLPFVFSSDLLTDDFTSKFSLKCKKNAGPVAVTIETEQGKDGGLTSKVGTKFSYAKFDVDKGQVVADGSRVLETSLKLTPEMKLSFKANKGADLGVDFNKGALYATGVLDVMDMSKVGASACLQVLPAVHVGADATYSLAGKTVGFSDYNVGASYANGPVFASVVSAGKFSAVNLGLLFKATPELTLASQTVHTKDKICNCLAVGGAFNAGPSVGTIKFKYDGLLNAALVREIAPAVMLTAAGSMNPKDPATFKPGLSISM
jgi:voltage-dependent anion channel protein 2